MARRSIHDPLQPKNAVTWLAVRNKYSELVEATELAPNADLRKILTAERDARIAAGWDANPIGPHSSQFFCKRDGVRLLVGIEARNPRSQGHGY